MPHAVTGNFEWSDYLTLEIARWSFITILWLSRGKSIKVNSVDIAATNLEQHRLCYVGHALCNAHGNASLARLAKSRTYVLSPSADPIENPLVWPPRRSSCPTVAHAHNSTFIVSGLKLADYCPLVSVVNCNGKQLIISFSWQLLSVIGRARLCNKHYIGCSPQ